jgi:NAD(P)-dependent dehydrogenase (short-subunit alcohol dehydrogenase family)
MVAFSEAHIVVTGGTGALGTAVVGRLRSAGAVCHVTNPVAAGLDHYAHSGGLGVYVTSGVDLADEAAVTRFYAGLPPLWASIHLAGGFAMAPVAETKAADFEAQFRLNALSCFLRSRAAIAAFRARSAPGRPGGATGGRVVNVAARPGIDRGSAPAWSPTPCRRARWRPWPRRSPRRSPARISGSTRWHRRSSTPRRTARRCPTHQICAGSSAEIAELIAFLASPDNRVTRGAVIPVYSGV